MRTHAILCGVLALVAGTAACTPVKPPERPTASAAQSLAGWYTQTAGEARFQPCGDRSALVVVGDAELRKRAAAFGLDDGLPVYVRLTGVRKAGDFQPTRVEQFGSPSPISDCPMTGTTIQH